MIEVLLIALAIWIVTFSIGNYINFKMYGNTIFKENDNEFITICLFYAPMFMIVMLYMKLNSKNR